MATEKRSIAVVWKNVRKMRSRERHSEIMDWIERSNCDICAVNETGLTGEEYMEAGYKTGARYSQNASVKGSGRVPKSVHSPVISSTKKRSDIGVACTTIYL